MAGIYLRRPGDEMPSSDWYYDYLKAQGEERKRQEEIARKESEYRAAQEQSESLRGQATDAVQGAGRGVMRNVGNFAESLLSIPDQIAEGKANPGYLAGSAAKGIGSASRWVTDRVPGESRVGDFLSSLADNKKLDNFTKDAREWDKKYGVAKMPQPHLGMKSWADVKEQTQKTQEFNQSKRNENDVNERLEAQRKSIEFIQSEIELAKKEGRTSFAELLTKQLNEEVIPDYKKDIEGIRGKDSKTAAEMLNPFVKGSKEERMKVIDISANKAMTDGANAAYFEAQKAGVEAGVISVEEAEANIAAKIKRQGYGDIAGSIAATIATYVLGNKALKGVIPDTRILAGTETAGKTIMAGIKNNTARDIIIGQTMYQDTPENEAAGGRLGQGIIDVGIGTAQGLAGYGWRVSQANQVIKQLDDVAAGSTKWNPDEVLNASKDILKDINPSLADDALDSMTPRAIKRAINQAGSGDISIADQLKRVEVIKSFAEESGNDYGALRAALDESGASLDDAQNAYSKYMAEQNANRSMTDLSVAGENQTLNLRPGVEPVQNNIDNMTPNPNYVEPQAPRPLQNFLDTTVSPNQKALPGMEVPSGQNIDGITAKPQLEMPFGAVDKVAEIPVKSVQDFANKLQKTVKTAKGETVQIKQGTDAPVKAKPEFEEQTFRQFVESKGHSFDEVSGPGTNNALYDELYEEFSKGSKMVDETGATVAKKDIKEVIEIKGTDDKIIVNKDGSKTKVKEVKEKLPEEMDETEFAEWVEKKMVENKQWFEEQQLKEAKESLEPETVGKNIKFHQAKLKGAEKRLKNGLAEGDSAKTAKADADQQYHLNELRKWQGYKKELPTTSKKIEPVIGDVEDRFVKEVSEVDRIHGLSVYSLDEYKAMDVAVTKDGTKGFAVKPDGDIVSVFNKSGDGQGKKAMIEAIEHGGRKLDCFDGFLKKYYEELGFKVTDRIKWSDEYAPDGWDFQKRAAKGLPERPDVIYMELDDEAYQAFKAANPKLYEDSLDFMRNFDPGWKVDTGDAVKPGLAMDKGNLPEWMKNSTQDTYGVAAGIGMEEDEDGNMKASFNPEMAALGMAGTMMMGKGGRGQIDNVLRQADEVVTNAPKLSDDVLKIINDVVPKKPGSGQAAGDSLQDALYGQPMKSLGKITDFNPRGEKFTPTVASSVEEAAQNRGILEGVSELPVASRVNMGEQLLEAQRFFNSDPERAMRVAAGLENPPGSLIPEMVFKIVEDTATTTNDVSMIKRLMTSSIATQDTVMGQRIAALAYRDPTSPVTAIRDVMNARLEAVGKAGKSLKNKPVTDDEIRQLVQFSNNVTKTREAMFAGGDRMEYGRALVARANYIEAISNPRGQMGLIDSLKDVDYIEKLKPGNWVGTAKDFARGTGGLAKSLKASFDNSVIGRQGLKTMWSHPKIWYKNAKQTFVDLAETFGGKEVLDEVKAEIHSRPNAVNGLYKKMNLAIGVVEEAYPTSSPGKIPGLGRAFRASEAAFEGFQFKTRADLADKYLMIAKETGVDISDIKELDAIGRLCNSLTGRGNLGSLEGAADAMNQVFFSARNLKSNWDTLTMHLSDKGASSFVKKEAAKNLVKIISGTAGVLVTANAVKPGSVEWDPTSADFGKIRLGNTRIDVTGGMHSIVTLASRLAKWEVKSSATGKVTKLTERNDDGELAFGARTGEDLVWDFFANKLSPVGGLVRNLLRQSTFEGEELTVRNQLSDLFMPLPIDTTEEIITDPNGGPFVLSMIAESIGFGTNTYGSIEGTGNNRIKPTSLYNLLGENEDPEEVKTALRNYKKRGASNEFLTDLLNRYYDEKIEDKKSDGKSYTPDGDSRNKRYYRLRSLLSELE